MTFYFSVYFDVLNLISEIMALTAAEKMKRRREKLKLEGKYEQYKKNHREVCRKGRLKKKAFLESISSKRADELRSIETEKIKQRVAKHRFKKRQNSIEDHEISYSSVQALGKATSRVRRALPACRNRRLAVIKKLWFENYEQEDYPDSPEKRKSATLPNDIKSKVEDFYERDDISRLCPGMRDFIIVRKGASKLKVQKRHLLSSISETYSLFVRENGICFFLYQH